MNTKDFTKDIALRVVRLAAEAYPPLGSLLDVALAVVPPEHQELAAEVRAILPVEGASAAAVRALEGDHE